MVTPRLAYLPRFAAVSFGSKQVVESQRAGALDNKFAQRVSDAPVRQQPKARANAVGRMHQLRLAGLLQQRMPFGIDELRIDQMHVAVGIRPHMPFALDVLTPQRMPVLILKTARRIIFDPEVVEALRSALEPDLNDGAVRI
ncbi:hypothetical protein SDC9_156091 [bioreactor metagenome]|uniref:Uncharacterized protein n=1 Tax=bioreactor metagenome TaxID=1076179 RepID=A0A645F5A8_9ZZZZ